jgi:Dullard-like phosphatase family protein
MPAPLNPSKEDTSQYFKKFNTAIQQGGSRSSGEDPTKRPTTLPSVAPSTGGKDALLTQVRQDALPTKTTTSSGITISSAAIQRRLQDIQSQPKNMSPVDPKRHPSLLSKPVPSAVGKKCLVLDVDETLVHSSYQPVHKYDLHLPLRVNGNTCNVYVAYRPFLREFLQAVAPLYEIVIFTASVSIYCDPLMNHIDPKGALGGCRLFREHCSVVNGSYVKDLSLLGRPLETVCIIDNSPVAYLFQPRNAIPILSWFNDPADDELKKLIPMLTEMASAPDVYRHLDEYNATMQEIASTDPKPPPQDPRKQ